MTTRYNYYTPSTTNVGVGCTSAVWRAQTFTNNTKHDVVELNLFLYRGSLPGLVTVSIREWPLTGPDLCSGTFDGDQITGSNAGEEVLISMGAGCTLEASTVYGYVIRPAGSGTIYNKGKSPGTLSGGASYYSTDGGDSWNSSSTDFWFEEWGEPWVTYHEEVDGSLGLVASVEEEQTSGHIEVALGLSAAVGEFPQPWRIRTSLGLQSTVSVEGSSAPEVSIGLSAEVSYLATYNRTLTPAASLRKVLRTAVGPRSEYEEAFDLSIALDSSRTYRTTVDEDLTGNVALSVSVDFLAGMTRVLSPPVALDLSLDRLLTIERAHDLLLELPPKRTAGVEKTPLQLTIGMISSSGRMISPWRKPEESLALYLPDETEGEVDEGVLGGVTQMSETPNCWHVQVYGTTDIYSSILEPGKISVREGATDRLSMVLYLDDATLGLESSDHIEVELRGRRGKVYKYSSEDDPPLVGISANGVVYLDPPSTLFKVVESPYELYVWVFKSANVKFAVPEKTEALIDVRGNY